MQETRSDPPGSFGPLSIQPAGRCPPGSRLSASGCRDTWSVPVLIATLFLDQAEKILWMLSPAFGKKAPDTFGAIWLENG